MVVAMERTTPPSRAVRAVPKLPDAERDRQADYLKYYLHDQRARACLMLETLDPIAGAWPSNTGMDPDMTELVKQLRPDGRHVMPTIKRVDKEPPSVLGMLSLVSPYPTAHWSGWRLALASLSAQYFTVIAMTVLDYYDDDFVGRTLQRSSWVIDTARREGLRSMVDYLHVQRCQHLTR